MSLSLSSLSQGGQSLFRPRNLQMTQRLLPRSTRLRDTSSSSMSSKLLRGKLPCPQCPSSDAYHEYSDGHGYCYSCGFVSNSSSNIDSHVNEECTGEFFPWRGISKQTMEFWNVWTKIDASGKPIELWYPYPDEAFKVRKLDK